MNECPTDSSLSRGTRGWATLALLILVASSLACGTGGLTTPLNSAGTSRRNNDIRRAVVAHELAQRGPADELLVAFGFLEVRANLNFTVGNTVWLQPVAEAEYFEQRVHRNPDRSYIFLHRPEVEGDTATVIVDRGSPATGQSYRLTLQRRGAGWSVMEDVPLEQASSLLVSFAMRRWAA